MSSPALKDPNYDLARELFVGMARRIYSVPSSPDQKKPDPKALAGLCFRLADAFELAARETPQMRAALDAATKASMKVDEVDLSGVFKNLTKKT
jgi:hypothetical protein